MSGVKISLADALAIPQRIHVPITIRLNDVLLDMAQEPATMTTPSRDKKAARRRKARAMKRAGKLDCISVAAEIKKLSAKQPPTDNAPTISDGPPRTRQPSIGNSNQLAKEQRTLKVKHCTLRGPMTVP